jgi:hypothetical protein
MIFIRLVRYYMRSGLPMRHAIRKAWKQGVFR